MDTRGDEPAGVGEPDTGTPHVARMYDYALGGARNFAVDRRAAEEVMRVWPDNREWAHQNRAFLRRVVHTLTVDYGIDQFLDVGSGIPTVGNVHEVAQHANPAARTAYVEWDVVAVNHARRLWAENPNVTMTQADVRKPDSVLTAPGVANLLDFTRPVAVLMLALLDILDLADPLPLIAAYRDACPSGSALALSNIAALNTNTAQRHEHDTVLATAATPQVRWREHTEVATFFTGYTLLEPGVVPTASWRPDEPVPADTARRSNAYAGAGLLP